MGQAICEELARRTFYSCQGEQEVEKNIAFQSQMEHIYHKCHSWLVHRPYVSIYLNYLCKVFI